MRLTFSALSAAGQPLPQKVLSVIQDLAMGLPSVPAKQALFKECFDSRKCGKCTSSLPLSSKPWGKQATHSIIPTMKNVAGREVQQNLCSMQTAATSDCKQLIRHEKGSNQQLPASFTVRQGNVNLHMPGGFPRANKWVFPLRGDGAINTYIPCLQQEFWRSWGLDLQCLYLQSPLSWIPRKPRKSHSQSHLDQLWQTDYPAWDHSPKKVERRL